MINREQLSKYIRFRFKDGNEDREDHDVDIFNNSSIQKVRDTWGLLSQPERRPYCFSEISESTLIVTVLVIAMVIVILVIVMVIVIAIVIVIVIVVVVLAIVIVIVIVIHMFCCCIHNLLAYNIIQYSTIVIIVYLVYDNKCHRTILQNSMSYIVYCMRTL